VRLRIGQGASGLAADAPGVAATDL
jgi:hypothetical protein